MASDPSHYRGDIEPFEDDYSTEPLIEVYSVIISPSKDKAAYEAFLVYGQISVISSDGQIIDIYDRPMHDPETIPSSGPRTLLLTPPNSRVIKMVGENMIYINLMVQGIRSQKKPKRHGRLNKWDVNAPRHDCCSVNGSFCLDEPDEPGYHEHISSTLTGGLVDVEVRYIYMPFARIAEVIVCFTQQSQPFHVSDDCSSPDAYISGKITAHYNSDIGTNSPPFILFANEHAPVHYGVPINLCRSLVCIPYYSSLSLKLYKLVFKEPTEKHGIVFYEDIEFDIFGFPHLDNHKFSKNNVDLHVRVSWYTTHRLECVRGEQNNLKGLSTSRIPKSSLPIPIQGWYRIQVLSVFVGHGGNEQVDICGTIEVKEIAVKLWEDFCSCTFDIFEKDKGCPENLFSGKAPTLEELTSYLRDRSYPGDSCVMHVKLKGVGSGHVDIDNSFAISEFPYSVLPGNWLNRPLCHVFLGKQGFAALHFILFRMAVKATVNISVIFKASFPPGSVNGTLVAQYSNYEYSTNYRRKYWSIDLFQKKHARSLPVDGEISLVRDVVSVPEGSSLILDADLYVSSGAAGTCVDHFVKKVEIRIGDVESRIKGQTYDVVVRTKWESGWE